MLESDKQGACFKCLNYQQPDKKLFTNTVGIVMVTGFGTKLDLGCHRIWFASLLGVPPQGFPSLGLPPCWASFGPLGNDCSRCLHALFWIGVLAGLVPYSN